MDVLYIKAIEKDLFELNRDPECVGDLLARIVVGDPTKPVRNDYVAACAYNLVKASFIYLKETAPPSQRTYKNAKTMCGMETGRSRPPIEFLFKDNFKEKPEDFSSPSAYRAFGKAADEYLRFDGAYRLEAAQYCKKQFERLIDGRQ
ncbi:MAG: hypothetical protein Q4E80_06240 [Slackia faecicanis]|nr:hypothetical protein [Slackia faecicanis]